jgi:SAM-dependent methyltransferase
MDRRDEHHSDRVRDLERVRTAYAEYAKTGRDRLWDPRNPGYARLAADLQSRLLEALSDSLKSEGPTRVLDLGCGEGDLAAEIPALDHPVQWIGVDLRDDAVATARARHPEHEFVVASADDLPFEAASMDVVVARLLFSSLPSTLMEVAVARQIGRILRPTGWLVWLDLRYPNPRNRRVHAVPFARMRALFPAWHMEVGTAGLLPPVARRLGRAAAAYPLLAAIPVFRSHLAGRLRPPAPPP